MNVREQIEQMRGEWTTKVMANVDGEREITLWGLGYENYPEPTYFEISVDGQVVTDWHEIDACCKVAVMTDDITEQESAKLIRAYQRGDYKW
jgi:hypothetical protein